MSCPRARIFAAQAIDKEPSRLSMKQKCSNAGVNDAVGRHMTISVADPSPLLPVGAQRSQVT